LEIRYLCFEELAAKGKVQRSKPLKDMTYLEYKTAAIRRNWIGPMIEKLRDNGFEEHLIYQVFLEELALIDPKLASDKIQYAIYEAARAVGLEAAALQKKLRNI
jgi:hypothetical protein